MRALCGAIITAAALLGLGLMSIAFGIRYQSYPYHDANGAPQFVYFRHLDTALMVTLVALLISLVIGLGIAFVGLAYHHHRRYHEFLRTQNGRSTTTGASAGTTTTGEGGRISV